jgi:hypothetical protein
MRKAMGYLTKIAGSSSTGINISSLAANINDYINNLSISKASMGKMSKD